MTEPGGKVPVTCSIALADGALCGVIAVGRCQGCERACCETHRPRPAGTQVLCADCSDATERARRCQAVEVAGGRCSRPAIATCVSCKERVCASHEAQTTERVVLGHTNFGDIWQDRSVGARICLRCVEQYRRDQEELKQAQHRESQMLTDRVNELKRRIIASPAAPWSARRHTYYKETGWLRTSKAHFLELEPAVDLGTATVYYADPGHTVSELSRVTRVGLMRSGVVMDLGTHVDDPHVDNRVIPVWLTSHMKRMGTPFLNDAFARAGNGGVPKMSDRDNQLLLALLEGCWARMGKR